MLGQLRYGLSVPGRISRLCYEDLWGARLGWDYLTEENAPAAMGLLCEQVVYLTGLVERVRA